MASVLRIFPAFWVVLVFGAVVVGPLAWLSTGHGLAGYWTLAEGGPVSYVLRNLSIFIFQYGIHDLFLDSPYGDLAHQPVINGSIWSIYFEVRLYLTIAILAALKVLVRARWLVPLGAASPSPRSFLVDRVPELVPVVHGLFGPVWGAWLAGVFLLGATAALYPEYVKLDGRLAAIAAVVAVQTLAIDGFVLIGDVCFAYVILWLCFRAPVWARRLPGRHDISYGVYLYAFPIQLLLTAYGVPEARLPALHGHHRRAHCAAGADELADGRAAGLAAEEPRTRADRSPAATARPGSPADRRRVVAASRITPKVTISLRCAISPVGRSTDF